MKVESFGNEWLEIELPFPCEIHHCYPRGVPSKNKFSVLLHSGEPSPLKWEILEVEKNYSMFDLILTNEEKLLHLHNAKFFIFGDSWITRVPEKKLFETSFLYSAGCGRSFNGYDLRSRIWAIQNKIEMPKKFWLSTINTPAVSEGFDKFYPYSTKDGLFDSMFSICVENLSEANYFTEKLIDAFRTFTIPIYFGCPNISDFFEKEGIICFNEIAELIDILNRLDANDYWVRLNYALINYQRSTKYLQPKTRITAEILESFARRGQSGIPLNTH